MKILESRIRMSNKTYVARLLNSVAKKLTFVKDNIDADVDYEIIHNEVLICRDILNNLLENITLES